jgi:CRISPR-associated endonuclease/helicase Cas3
VTKAALGCKTGGLMVVEAPMGVGKTEAALLAAEIYAKKAGRAGVFFALPTQATSDGIFPRFLDWIEKLDEFMTHSLRLAHGKAQFNDLYNELKKTDDSESFDSVQIDVDSQEDRSAIVHSWFEGNKKSMLADFVVGTVDQLLLMALKQRHLMLRHLGLAGKVVIVDECHAYDAYMSQYLQMALKWLGVYGVPVIVLSATLPLKKRKELVGAYLGMSEKHISRLDAPWGDNVSYPLITFTDGKDVNQIQADIDSTSLRRLEIKPLDSKDIEDKLEELLESGGCAGVIVNTVRRAQCFARRLKQRFGSENVLLVHSAFIAPDRIKRERRFLDQMGKKGIRKLKIVVGTQVLEQSLDFDVDVMITDLAPMDLLLQRMGRLQRHERKRPKRFSTATCYVMESQGELEDGAKAIYGEYLLARTKHYLPASIELPGDIPALVQSVYDEEIEICPEPSGYSEMKHEFQQMILGKQNRANDFRIQAETKRKSLHGWIDREASACGEKDSAQVRDSEPSVEVLVLQQAETGVRMLGGKEVFPQDQTPPSGHAREIARQILRLPGAVCRACFNKKEAIDELEDQSQRRLAAWQDSPWLKGELFLILDENMEASLNGYRLKYDAELGLQYEKEEE